MRGSEFIASSGHCRPGRRSGQRVRVASTELRVPSRESRENQRATTTKGTEDHGGRGKALTAKGGKKSRKGSEESPELRETTKSTTEATEEHRDRTRARVGQWSGDPQSMRIRKLFTVNWALGLRLWVLARPHNSRAYGPKPRAGKERKQN